MDELERYKRAYDILSEYFDCIPDEERWKAHEKLLELDL